MLPSSLPQSQDIPFTVQGYISDPKLVGYQILTNYESTYWAPFVGNDAWRLYEVLRSFCHHGNSACHPSINLLMAILNVKDRSVLIGRAKPKAVKGKAYSYPGLIQILQDHNLVIAEVSGEGPLLRYSFHVNLTLSLLTSEQLRQLPQLLQEKHQALLDRCEAERNALEAKKKPAKLPISGAKKGDSAENGGIGISNTPLGNSNTPSWNFQYKQHPINTTQLTPEDARAINNNSSVTATNSAVVVAFSAPKIAELEETAGSDHTTSGMNTPTPLDPPAPTPAQRQTGESALLAAGLAPRVAQRLATRYGLTRITEKLDFLAYLQEQDPERVKNPRGWLRRAIEEDYAAPDGFLSPAERDRLAQEAAQRAQAQAEDARVAAELTRAQQTSREAKQQAFVQTLQAQYGTTTEDYAFWTEVKRELSYLARPDLFVLIEDAHILQCTNDTVRIGIVKAHALRQLSHPNTQTAIQRACTRVAGRLLDLAFVLVAPPGEPESRRLAGETCVAFGCQEGA